MSHENITPIDHYKRQQVVRWWDSLDESTDRWFHEFMRALTLATRYNPDATAALMRGFAPTSMNEAIKVYHALLKISADAINSHLIKPAANDD